MKETNKSRNKSKMAAVIAVLLVCVLAVGGTIAYLTTHSKLTNSFTVGNIGSNQRNQVRILKYRLTQTIQQN